jgi:tRNA threonylcarbamoyladenosine biosynthesis protein TsaE
MVTTTSTVEETRMLGGQVAALSQPGDIYALEGDLGTGKTEFVRGFAGALDGKIVVRSPSFAIVNTYRTSRFPVYHFDFYRLSDSSELVETGFDEYLDDEGVCLIEWATMFPDVLPENTRYIRFTDTGNHKREIDLTFPLGN